MTTPVGVPPALPMRTGQARREHTAIATMQPEIRVKRGPDHLTNAATPRGPHSVTPPPSTRPPLPPDHLPAAARTKPLILRKPKRPDLLRQRDRGLILSEPLRADLWIAPTDSPRGFPVGTQLEQPQLRPVPPGATFSPTAQRLFPQTAPSALPDGALPAVRPHPGLAHTRRDRARVAPQSEQTPRTLRVHRPVFGGPQA